MPLPSILARLLGQKNLRSPSSEWKLKSWDSAQVEASLVEMFTYAQENAQRAEDWYWEKKRWKAITSRTCRLATILFTAAATLIPILGSVAWVDKSIAEQTQQMLWTLKMNQAGYFCLGLAGLSLALDRFLSGSTSWMRYVGTATSIQTATEQFRLDWDRLRASQAGKQPEGQDLVTLINRITEFSVTVRALVEGETKAWAAEFQANLAELQKSTAAAVETARAEFQAAQKKADTEQQATRPGGIDLTVDNAADTDQGYEVRVDDQVKKSGITSKTCGILGIPPGIHELSVQAKIGSVSASASQLVTIAAGSATRAQLSLAKQKASGAGARVP